MPSDFLPPDPYADLPGTHRPGGPPVFAPPDAARPAAAKGHNNRAVVALALGSAGLGVLFFTAGALFVLTLPASIVGWVLGNKAKQVGARADQANVAVIMGVVGTIAGVIATIVWVLIWTKTA